LVSFLFFVSFVIHVFFRRRANGRSD
jgi:hypothetical protein